MLEQYAQLLMTALSILERIVENKEYPQIDDLNQKEEIRHWQSVLRFASSRFCSLTRARINEYEAFYSKVCLERPAPFQSSVQQSIHSER